MKADNGKQRQTQMSLQPGFLLPWMQQGGAPIEMPPGRHKYPGRLSDTGGGRGGKGSRQGAGGAGGGRGSTKQPPLIIARPSLDVELKSAGEKAWKPSHKVANVNDQEQTETMVSSVWLAFGEKSLPYWVEDKFRSSLGILEHLSIFLILEFENGMLSILSLQFSDMFFGLSDEMPVTLLSEALQRNTQYIE